MRRGVMGVVPVDDLLCAQGWSMTRKWDQQPEDRGFTLLELLIAIAIVVVVLAVAMPSVRALLRGSNVKQATNMINAYVASARATAMAAKRRTAVIFYEESGNYTTSWDKNQTVVQIAIEDANQDQYAARLAPSGSTEPAGNFVVLIPYSQREYLPNGVRVAGLCGNGKMSTADALDAATRARAIVFNADGQMEIRKGLACNFMPNGSPTPARDSPLLTVGDWGLIAVPATVSSPPPAASTTVVSTIGVIAYDSYLYGAQSFPTDTDRANWLQKNADVVVVNAYTGNVIR